MPDPTVHDGSTARLAEFATSLRLSSLTEDARHAARWGILDAVACAVAGTDERVSRLVRDWLEADRPRGPSTVWATDRTSTPAGAALANATAAHALDFDDVCWAMNAHPSAVLAPTALVMGEATGASGADVLLAYCTGFEVAGRLGEAMGQRHYEAGWHPTATLGTVGATVVAAVLLGLGTETLASAVGIACSMAAGSRMNFGTDTKPLHAGLAAESGIAAAELARRGVTARLDGLEAPMGFAALYHGASSEVRTDVDSFCLTAPGIEHKPYPSCRFTHRVIEALARLRERHPGRVPEVIECTMDPLARQILIYPEATSALEAKFSLAWCAALTWLDGPPDVATFNDERIRRADVRDLATRVRVRDGSAASETVVVSFTGGDRDEETIASPLGHPSRPLEREQHIGKLQACIAPRLGVERASRIITRLEHIEREPAIGDVVSDFRWTAR